MREPSKEQLQEAGVLPNWNAQKKLKSKDRGETDLLLQKQSEVNRQQSRRPDERSRRGVSVFADRASGGRHHVAYTAVLTDGASYQSSAGSSQSSGSEYWCAECRDVVIQGGGGILECSTCRGNRSYRPDDSVALLGLRTKNYNHRTGVIVNRVQRENGIRYGVLLAGKAKPVAIRPDNLRPLDYSAMFAAPGHRDKPQERTAHVVVFKEADVQTDGASYESSEWRTVPEKNKEYSDVASNLVLNPWTGMIMDSDGGAENGTVNKPGGGVVVVRTLPDTDQPELRCTCCEW